jgi:uncharacterized protein with HEPN domain
MSKSAIEFLKHILIEADYIVQSSENKGFDDLMNDATWQRAVVRSLEIIGEAAKKIDEDFRLTYPQVEWRSLARMRDKLIHHYFGVDYEIVWNILINKIPDLQASVSLIIDSLE